MPIPRLHLFELEDQPWFPATIRDFATDYLLFIETQFKLHLPMVPLLKSALQDSNTTAVVDLCSGGGGPVIAVYESLAAQGIPIHVILTDLYPNRDAFQKIAARHPGGIDYNPQPVDATRVPAELRGLRTMFNAFHHFAPDAARSVLASAVAAGQPIAIVEIPERAFSTFIPLLLSPLFVALATPFIRPFSWSRLFWTYLIPLVPLTCLFDGLVSQLRAYEVGELLQLTEGLEGYDWKSDRVKIGTSPGQITYLVGIPKAGGG